MATARSTKWPASPPASKTAFVPPHVMATMAEQGLALVRQRDSLLHLFGRYAGTAYWDERSGEVAYFAPAWQVLLAEAEPMSDPCRAWAVRACAADPNLQAELDVVARLVKPGHRDRFAELVIERWIAAAEGP